MKFSGQFYLSLSLLLLQLFASQISAFLPDVNLKLRQQQSTQTIQPRWLFSTKSSDDEDTDDDDFSMEAFQNAKENAASKRKEKEATAALEEFDGYAFRDVILEKWGSCYDVDFNRVDSFGFRSVYLNVMPYRLEGRGRFRHDTELDYLCHLQAVVEILQKYNQLDYILDQIQETNKKPRPNTSPIVAVPLRLDLTPEEVKQILNF